MRNVMRFLQVMQNSRDVLQKSCLYGLGCIAPRATVVELALLSRRDAWPSPVAQCWPINAAGESSLYAPKGS